MTTPRITSAPEEGHGLIPRVMSGLYADRALGKPTEDLVVVGILKADGHGERKGKQFVNLLATALEVVPDHEQEYVLKLIHAQREARCPTPLPLAFPGWPDPEQRTFLVDAIKEWAKEEGMSAADLRESVVDYFGGPEFAPANVDKLSVVQAREFATFKGVIADDVADAGGEPEEAE